LGRIRFPPRSEPAIDWSEIESRLQEISAGTRPTDLAVDPSVTLANDLATANDPPLTNDLSVTSDPPVISPTDPLAEMLSRLGEGAVSRSHRQDIAEFPTGIEPSASMASQPATDFNRVRAGSN
jgi:hypothetical protein